jgi:hypothetical protein
MFWLKKFCLQTIGELLIVVVNKDFENKINNNQIPFGIRGDLIVIKGNG